MKSIPPRPTFQNRELFRPAITQFVANYFREEIEEDGGSLEDEGEVMVDVFLETLNYANWPEDVMTRLIKDHNYDFDYSLWDNVQEFSSEMRTELERLKTAWANEHNVQPQFPIGTEVIYNGQRLIIDNVSEHDVASYSLRNPDAPQFIWYAPFENVHLATDQTA